MSRPTRYAALSAAQTAMRTVNAARCPWSASPRTAGSRAATTRIRDQNPLGARSLSPAEAAAAARIVLQCGAEIGLAEVGPEAVDEGELGVGELPEEEVRDAKLAGSADEEIRVGHVGRVEVLGEELLVDVLGLDAGLDDPPRGLDQLRAAAVVERDPELESLVPSRLVLERGHPLPEVERRAVPPADEPRSHALLRQIRQLALDRLAEDLHQSVHLVRRPSPVLGRERVHGEGFDP